MTFPASMGASSRAKPLSWLRTTVTAFALPLAACAAYGEGFDSYAISDGSESVLANEGVVLPPLDYSYSRDHFGYDANCVGNCTSGRCGACSGCQNYGSSGAGALNRVLGDACPRWTAQVDALMLWQSNVQAVPLLVLDNPTNPATFLSTNQLVTDMAVGPRAALMLHVDQEHALEGNYFYVGSISSTRTFDAPLPQQLVWDGILNIAQFGNIDSGTVTANGEIQSFELNWRHRHCGSPITWLVGFRWVEWNESLTLADSYSSRSGFGDDLLLLETGNDLYGAQLGMDAILLTLGNVIRFNGVAKAGVYGNDATASTFVQTDRPLFGPPRTFSGTTTQTGFFGEIGINGAVRLSEHFFWRAGYNFFWLSGVAVASQQLGTVNAAADPAQGAVTAGSSVFLQGVNTGIEFIW
jgi:hypothetical protein